MHLARDDVKRNNVTGHVTVQQPRYCSAKPGQRDQATANTWGADWKLMNSEYKNTAQSNSNNKF